MVKSMKLLLYQNICVVYLNLIKTLNDNESSRLVIDAYVASNEAIKLDMRSSKAYYLRARLRLCKS